MSEKPIFLSKEDLGKIETAKAEALKAEEKCKQADDFLCAMMTAEQYHDKVTKMFAEEFAPKYGFDMSRAKGWDSKTGKVNMMEDGEEAEDEEEEEAEEEEEE